MGAEGAAGAAAAARPPPLLLPPCGAGGAPVEERPHRHPKPEGRPPGGGPRRQQQRPPWRRPWRLQRPRQQPPERWLGAASGGSGAGAEAPPPPGRLGTGREGRRRRRGARRRSQKGPPRPLTPDPRLAPGGRLTGGPAGRERADDREPGITGRAGAAGVPLRRGDRCASSELYPPVQGTGRVRIRKRSVETCGYRTGCPHSPACQALGTVMPAERKASAARKANVPGVAARLTARPAAA